MRHYCELILRGILFFIVSVIVLCPPATVIAKDDYDFDMEQFAPKRFKWGGYSEVMLDHIYLNTSSSFYKLNFHEDPLTAVNRFYGTMQLELSYRKGFGAFNSVLHAKAGKDNFGWSDTEDIYEANLSLKPSPFVTIDLGKKVSRWGKGYAWNPVGFIDRPKDPNNPEESLEGYTGASIDIIKSLNGALQTVALTTIVLPVRDGINEDFGEINHLNLAVKLYLLCRDTDIDFVIFNGNSRSTSYGVDFSRNLVSNFEIHGEFAHLIDLTQNYLSETGTLNQRKLSAIRYLLGMRYLTENDITTIIEYYHNGAGFSESELERFYQLIDDADIQLLNTETDALYQTAKNISKMGYSSPQSGRNYLYMKISQKNPFDILYFTPGLIAIINLDDQSSSISPEMLYTGYTNWEMRLRLTLLHGRDFTEFEEKQNEYKLELRVRYHF
jgi:hypothetical protein